MEKLRTGKRVITKKVTLAVAFAVLLLVAVGGTVVARHIFYMETEVPPHRLEEMQREAEYWYNVCAPLTPISTSDGVVCREYDDPHDDQ